MTYEYPTSINWSEGFDQVIYYVNDVTNSWVSILLLVAIYIITAVSVFSSERTPDAIFNGMATAGFLLIILGTIFWIADFISGVVLIFAIAVAIISFASLWLKGN